MRQDIVNGLFSDVNKILWSIDTICDGQKLHIVNMKILPPLNVINSICFFFSKEKCICEFFVVNHIFC